MHIHYELMLKILAVSLISQLSVVCLCVCTSKMMSMTRPWCGGNQVKAT